MAQLKAIDYAARLLRGHEKYKQFVYKCTAGKNTIGYGRNVEDRGISKPEAEFLLNNDIVYCHDQLASRLPFYDSLDDVRKAVLIDMAVNLGIHGLMCFKKTLNLISVGSYKLAAEEMLKSKWADQVGYRAGELSEMMASGEMK